MSDDRVFPISDLVDIKKAAEILCVSDKTIRRYIKTNKLKSEKIRNVWFLNTKEIYDMKNVLEYEEHTSEKGECEIMKPKRGRPSQKGEIIDLSHKISHLETQLLELHKMMQTLIVYDSDIKKLSAPAQQPITVEDTLASELEPLEHYPQITQITQTVEDTLASELEPLEHYPQITQITQTVEDTLASELEPFKPVEPIEQIVSEPVEPSAISHRQQTIGSEQLAVEMQNFASVQQLPNHQITKSPNHQSPSAFSLQPSELTSLQQALDSTIAERNQLQDKVKDYEEKLCILQESLDFNTKEKEQLKSKMEELENRIANFQKSREEDIKVLEEKMNIIQNLKNTIISNEKGLAQLRNEVEEKHKIIEGKKLEIENLKEKIFQLEIQTKAAKL